MALGVSRSYVFLQDSVSGSLLIIAMAGILDFLNISHYYKNAIAPSALTISLWLQTVAHGQWRRLARIPPNALRIATTSGRHWNICRH